MDVEYPDSSKIIRTSVATGCGSEAPSDGKVCYIVNVQFSDYKEDASEPDSYLFKYEERARNFMRKAAKKLYYIMVEEYCEDDVDKDEEGDMARNCRECIPPEEKGSSGPFWYENQDEITFGEDCSMGQCYRRAWGAVTISKITMDKAKK